MDALQKPIQIGSRYGYSQSKNGFTYVRIGIATKENEGKTTLRLESSSRSLYNDDLKEEKLTNKSIVCKSTMLFPINE